MRPSPGVGIHSGLPSTLVHFTGRPRSIDDRPPAHGNVTAEDRLVGVLREGKIRGSVPYRPAGHSRALNIPRGRRGCGTSLLYGNDG